MRINRLPHVIALFLCLAASTSYVAARDVHSPSDDAHVRSAPRQSRYIQMRTAIGDDYFDGRDSVQRIRRHLKVARALGVRYLRCGFSWNGIEPERGVYNFEFWDKLVAEAARSHVELIPYVAYTPQWAAGRKDEFWKRPPADPSDYANVMRVLAERYRGKIRHWELWNEPDNKEYWDGSPDDFATTVILAANAVREVAPENVLVLGGMSQGPGSFFDVLIAKYHVDQYVDVLALHGYPESWHEERAETVFGNWIENMDAVARRSGLGLWLNEMGYADYRYRANHASLWGTSTYYDYEHTSRYGADFLFKSFVMTLGVADVSLAGWYRIDDFREDDARMPSDKVHDHLGVISVNGKKKPAFYAFRFFNSLLSQPVRVTYSASGDRPARSAAVTRVFQRKDGKVIVAGWLRSSQYAEVPIHSGMEHDERSERTDIPLPCTAATVDTFSAMGDWLSRKHPHRSVLKGVTLTGDRVFVANVTCTAEKK